MSTADPFSIEQQYQRFLKLAKLQESAMHRAQGQEMRRSFFGGAGALLALLHDDIPRLSEDDATVELDRMVAEVKEFWRGEAERQREKYVR